MENKKRCQALCQALQLWCVGINVNYKWQTSNVQGCDIHESRVLADEIQKKRGLSRNIPDTDDSKPMDTWYIGNAIPWTSSVRKKCIQLDGPL